MNYKILWSGVKKTIIFFTLIFLFISQTNIGVVYAQSLAELESQKDASIEVLDKTEIVVGKVIDKLDEKINDERGRTYEVEVGGIDSGIEQEIADLLNTLFEDLNTESFQINADQTPEQAELESKLPTNVVNAADNILYNYVKPLIDNRDNKSAIDLLTILISKYEEKQIELSGKRKTLAKYIGVTLEIFKVEREFDANNSSDIQELKRQKIELEIRLLELNYEITKLKQELSINQGKIEGYEQAIDDYITSYVELADITEIPALIKGIANIDLNNISNSIDDLYETYINIDEILASLEEGKQAYYKSYLKTTLALTAIPVQLNKATKFTGKKVSSNACPFSVSSVDEGTYIAGDCERDVYGELITLLKAWQAKRVLDNVLEISTKISHGHAYTKHIDEFTKFNINTKTELQLNTERILKQSTGTDNMKVGSNGRIAYWDNSQEVIVIYNPKDADFGTTFVPTEGKTYFTNFK